MINSKTETGAIMADLELDYSDFLSNPVVVSKRILAKGEELMAVCKQDTSVGALTSQIRDAANKVDTPIHVLELMKVLYSEGDEVSIPELVQMIDSAQQLVNDLKGTLRDRITQEATQTNSTVNEKRLAHLQYVRLRKAYDTLREFWKIMDEDTYKQMKLMPALPGNYGGAATLSAPMFFIKGQEGGYYNWRAVAKLVGGLEFLARFNDMRDWLDWCETPEGEDVIEIRQVKK